MDYFMDLELLLTKMSDVNSSFKPNNTSDNSTSNQDYIFSDYLKIGCLSLLFVLGAPINFVVFWRLQRRLRVSGGGSILLHFALSVSDLLIVFVYVPSELIWLCTYEWRGGEFLCKMKAFFDMFAFQLSSNIVVCISIDRVLLLCSVGSGRFAITSRKRIQTMIVIAWLIAVVCCIPQLLTWTVVQPYQNSNFQQCVNVLRKPTDLPADDETGGNNLTTANNSKSAVVKGNEIVFTLYSVFHLTTVFWLPCIVVTFCYVFILRKLIISTFGEQNPTSASSSQYLIGNCRPNSTASPFHNSCSTTTAAARSYGRCRSYRSSQYSTFRQQRHWSLHQTLIQERQTQLSLSLTNQLPHQHYKQTGYLDSASNLGNVPQTAERRPCALETETEAHSDSILVVQRVRTANKQSASNAKRKYVTFAGSINTQCDAESTSGRLPFSAMRHCQSDAAVNERLYSSQSKPRLDIQCHWLFRNEKPIEPLNTTAVSSKTSAGLGPQLRIGSKHKTGNTEAVDSQLVAAKRTKKMSQAQRMAVVIILAYLCCWLPYNVSSLWDVSNSMTYADEMNWLEALIVVTSIINPFVYYRFYLRSS